MSSTSTPKFHQDIAGPPKHIVESTPHYKRSAPDIFKNKSLPGPEPLCNEPGMSKELDELLWYPGCCADGADGDFIGVKLSFDERKNRIVSKSVLAEDFFRKEYLCDFSNQEDDREYNAVAGKPTGRVHHKTRGAHISSAVFDELDV